MDNGWGRSYGFFVQGKDQIEEMAQSVKSLPQKHEVLSSIHRTQAKSRQSGVYIPAGTSWESETGRP